MRIPQLLAVCINGQSLHLGLQTATRRAAVWRARQTQLNAYFPGSQYVHVCSPAELFTLCSAVVYLCSGVVVNICYRIFSSISREI